MSTQGQATASHNRHDRALRHRRMPSMCKYIEESAYQDLLIAFGLADIDGRQARRMGLRTWNGGAQW